MKRVLCYGDSNTWGYIPGSNHQRFGDNERWTRLLKNNLGNDFEIIEEGLNSRTLFTNDDRPGKEGRQGFSYLKPCLDTHDKIDIVVLMLATNEMKDAFNNSAESIVEMLDKFVDYILNFKSQIDNSSPKLILCGVPPISESENSIFANDKYKNAPKKCEKFISLCDKYFNDERLIYVKNNDLKVGVDCIHLTSDGHKCLADKLTQILKNI